MIRRKTPAEYWTDEEIGRQVRFVLTWGSDLDCREAGFGAAGVVVIHQDPELLPRRVVRKARKLGGVAPYVALGREWDRDCEHGFGISDRELWLYGAGNAAQATRAARNWMRELAPDGAEIIPRSFEELPPMPQRLFARHFRGQDGPDRTAVLTSHGTSTYRVT